MHIGRRNQMRPRTIIRVVVNSHIFGSIPAFIFFFVNAASHISCHVSGIVLYLHCTSLFSRGITYLFIFIRSWCRLFSSVNERQKTNIDSRALK